MLLVISQLQYELDEQVELLTMQRDMVTNEVTHHSIELCLYEEDEVCVVVQVPLTMDIDQRKTEVLDEEEQINDLIILELTTQLVEPEQLYNEIMDEPQEVGDGHQEVADEQVDQVELEILHITDNGDEREIDEID